MAQIRRNVRVPVALRGLNDSAVVDPRAQFTDVHSLHTGRFSDSRFPRELLRWNNRSKSKKRTLGFNPPNLQHGGLVHRAVLRRLSLHFLAGLRVHDIYECTAVSGHLCVGPTQRLVSHIALKEVDFYRFLRVHQSYFRKNLLEEVVQLSLITIDRKGNKRHPMSILRCTLQETGSA